VALQTGPSGLDPQQRVVVQMIAEEYHVFHWHIAFPELFGEGRANGFSVVLGNPPWERIALEDIEYFSGIDDSIASIKNTSRRKQAIQELRKSNSGVYNAYEKKCESSARMAHFFQSCSLYALSSSGRINLYPLFVDLGNRIMQRSGGFSMIIPSGIATDAPLAAFWRAISDDGRLSAFFDFENSHGLFPAVHREMNFSILSLVGKESSAKGSSTFCFRAKSTSDLLNEDYRFNLPSNILSVVSPNTGQPLVCRTRREYEICSSIYRNSVIFRADGESGNRNRCFVGMTSAEYSHLLRSVVESSNDHVPVIEAKMIGQYNLYLGGFDPQPGNREDWTRTEYVLSHDRESPPLRPRHVVERDVADQFYRDMEIRLPYYAGIRDVTNINNERTAISAILPRLPILQPLNGILCESPEQLVYVVAMINSKAVDFIARRRFTGRHLNVTTTNQLPIPRLDKNDLQCVVRAAFRLSYSTNMLDQLAHDLGYTDKPGILEPDDRDKLLDTIDALVFKACRLKRDDIEYILDTFDVLRDREIQRYGIYRSKLSILNIIDHQDREPSHA
jgi:hypothetical protein